MYNTIPSSHNGRNQSLRLWAFGMTLVRTYVSSETYGMQRKGKTSTYMIQLR